ncbi:MAG: hypothetical protein KDA28_16560 [Phycisphaerales bacterium]|nr:hypothetical protein [Phycisphaerales bacterium]
MTPSFSKAEVIRLAESLQRRDSNFLFDTHPVWPLDGVESRCIVRGPDVLPVKHDAILIAITSTRVNFVLRCFVCPGNDVDLEIPTWDAESFFVTSSVIATAHLTGRYHLVAAEHAFPLQIEHVVGAA